MICILSHECEVHAVYRLFAWVRTPPTCDGGVAVLSNDEEGRNIHPVTSNRANESVAIAITMGLYNGVAPTSEKKENREWNEGCPEMEERRKYQEKAE